MSFGDTLIEEGAIRRPQLDLFGQDLLGESLRDALDPKLRK